MKGIFDKICILIVIILLLFVLVIETRNKSENKEQNIAIENVERELSNSKTALSRLANNIYMSQRQDVIKRAEKKGKGDTIYSSDKDQIRFICGTYEYMFHEDAKFKKSCEYLLN